MVSPTKHTDIYIYIWIIEGKNRIKGEGGGKNDSKKSDIIYEWSLIKNIIRILIRIRISILGWKMLLK